MTHQTDRLSAARAQFPITRGKVYFDTANMASPPIGVTNALTAFFARQQRTGGDKAAWLGEVETTRLKAAQLLDCAPEEIAFVKNTSEGLNIAANAIDWRVGDNVVLPSREHPNNVFPWLNLRRLGVEVRLVPDNGALVDARMLRPHVDSRTRAIAVADVSFQPGQRNDLASLGALCQDLGAHLVVDGVQAIGLLRVQPRKLGVSMWAASALALAAQSGAGRLSSSPDLRASSASSGV